MKPSTAQLEQAAKTLAEIMDYPWEPMPEQGRETMRQHALKIIEPAICEHCDGAGKILVYGIEESWEESCQHCEGATADWQLVPIEPTREMVEAAQWEDGGATARAVYSYMLKAAPKHG